MFVGVLTSPDYHRGDVVTEALYTSGSKSRNIIVLISKSEG